MFGVNFLRVNKIGHTDTEKQKLYTQDNIKSVDKMIKLSKWPAFIWSLLLVAMLVCYASTTVIDNCSASCRLNLVESIPEGMDYGNETINPSIFESWLQLIEMAESSIDIAAFYFSLNGVDVVPHPSAWQGETVFEKLKEAGTQQGIKIRIAQNLPSASQPDVDTRMLQQLGAAEVRNLDFKKLVGAGILHTKLIVVDQRHFFVGSANMDWRALTQVKELGAAVYDCPRLAADMYKTFEVYWDLGKENAAIPTEWPAEYSTVFNHNNPMEVNLNGNPAKTYIASSPPQLCPSGRTTDLESILSVMDHSRQYINIAVMDYIPAMLYTPRPQYWPDIDNQIRRLAIDRAITIKLLVSNWSHTNKAMKPFLKSLIDISKVYPHVDIQVKIFVVPVVTPDQGNIPYARVNHNKYMVTDNAAYVGTSNWSGDYFVNTGGIGLIINDTATEKGQETFRNQLKQVFDRDWNSEYATPL